MVKDTLATNHRLIVMTLPLPEKSNGSEIYKLACAGKLISFEETLDGRFLISLSGIMRCKLLDTLEEKGGYRRMKVDFTDYLSDMMPNNIKIERNFIKLNSRTFSELKCL